MTETDPLKVEHAIALASRIGQARHGAEMRAVDILTARAAEAEGEVAFALLAAAREILGEVG